MAAARPGSLSSFAGSLVLLAVVVCLGAVLIRPALTGVLWGAFAYTLYRTLIARRWICRHHHRAVRHFRHERFDEAHQAFVDSEGFFRRHPWLDQWRSLLLGSASTHTFAELAGYNQALCLRYLGQDEEALRRLDLLLDERPHMAAAIALRGALTTPGNSEHHPKDPDSWFA